MESGPDASEETPVPFGTFRPAERRALIACAFASGCVLLMPQELIGSGISFTVAVALYLWHRRRLNKEGRAPGTPLLPPLVSNSAALSSLAVDSVPLSTLDSPPAPLPSTDVIEEPAAHPIKEPE